MSADQDSFLEEQLTHTGKRTFNRTRGRTTFDTNYKGYSETFIMQK